MKIERVNRELVYKGAIIDMYRDTVITPNGKEAHWDFIGHKGAAAVLPVMEDGRILLVRQYRNALDRETLEVPAGGRDGLEESYLTCASRELIEETGYKGETFEFLLSLKTTVAFCNEQIDVFVAKGLTFVGQDLDEDEDVVVEAYTVKELLEKIYAGEMQDSKTVASILAYANKYSC